MNKGFLVLENGCVLSGKTDATSNVFGQVAFSGTLARVSNEADVQNFTLDHAFDANTPLTGKIVTDTLPVEYHMYDVKNSTF